MKLFHKGLLPGLYDQKRYDPLVFRLAIAEFERAAFEYRGHWFLNVSNPRVQRNNSGTIGIRITYKKHDHRIPVRAIAYFIEHGKFPYPNRINYFSITCGNCDCCNPSHVYYPMNHTDPWYSTRLLKGKKIN